MKQRKKKRWIWSLLTIPALLIVAGGVIVWHYGWSFTKQTVLLGYTAVNPYKPIMPNRTYQELWPNLPEPGQKIGELSVPALHIQAPVVQGTHMAQLALGVGHYAGSTLPGQGGDVVLAGHRDTVFTRLQYLKVGYHIVFTTPYGPFTYEVTKIVIVPKTDMNIIVPQNYETLTLTTCFPFVYIGFAPNRYIVYTKLLSEPAAAKAASGLGVSNGTLS